MPSYSYECDSCGKSFTGVSKVDDRNIPCETPCECGGHIKIVITSIGYIYNRTGALRTDSDFNNRLQEIRNATPERYRKNLDKNIR